MSFQHLPSNLDGTPTVDFSVEDVEFELADSPTTVKWLEKIIEQEEKKLRLLNFIFCSDEYLHQLNVEYLDHDTLTDIITFPYAEPPIVEGDIFISIDRVRENAKKFEVPFSKELNRVMVHGVLHLCGYGDKSDEEAKLMRSKEDEALALLS